MLDEMTSTALKVLNHNNRNGFVLMVEGASIDKQLHLMDTDRWILETIEFDRAVQKARDFARANPDTIVIVTADHECSGAAIIGAAMVTDAALRAKAASSAEMRDSVVGVYEAARLPRYTFAADAYPQTTDVDHKMQIGYGANADRYDAWVSNPQPTQDLQQPFVGQAPLNTYPASPNARNASTGYLWLARCPANRPCTLRPMCRCRPTAAAPRCSPVCSTIPMCPFKPRLNIGSARWLKFRSARTLRISVGSFCLLPKDASCERTDLGRLWF